MMRSSRKIHAPSIDDWFESNKSRDLNRIKSQPEMPAELIRYALQPRWIKV
jgi:hypothetical protein